jgi:hypothetical protein
MTGRKNLVAIGLEERGEATPQETVETDAPAPEWDGEEQESARFGRGPAILATLAIALAAGWTGFFGWVHQQTILRGATPAEWATLIVDWAVPVLLVVALWMLVMRNSRREASRFNEAAHALSVESALLERRLVTVNRELSLARDFIAAQSRDLESLGRVAAERLSENADRLQGLIRNNGAEVDRIGQVSTTALENMDRLRDGLPVISNSARDTASQIGHAGGVAKEQLDELVAGFNRLNEFGEASGRQVTALRGRVDEALAAFSAQAAQLDEIAGNRFAALAEKSAAFRAELDGREVEAFAAIRRRADALREELGAGQADIARNEASVLDALRERMAALRDEGTRMAETLRTGEHDAAEAWSRAVSELEQRLTDAIRRVTEVDQHAMDSARQRLAALGDEARRVDETMAERSSAFDRQFMLRTTEASRREAELLETLDQRLAEFDDRVAERQEDHLAHVAGLAERGDALALRLAELGEQMAQLSAQGRETQDGLAEAAGGLAARLGESQALIAGSGTSIARLTDDSVRLLELIRSSAEHTGEDLPRALGEAEQRLVAFERQTGSLRDLIADAETKGETLAAHVETARATGNATLEELTALETRLAELARQSDEVAGKARGELQDAIATLEQAATGVVAGLRAEQVEAIRDMAERIGAESSDAIVRTVRANAASAIAELESATLQAGHSGREVALQLRDQLAVVNELAGNLERRVAHAKEQAEEKLDHDFTRRMALINESLNSSAIDISKAFANDVTDTAWASYLRGDRGIFTRRAVRLLDNQQARAIAEIYEDEPDFRETVNRYIHDFEAMLRGVLSTRDGNAMAVTLLSSDIGKLYVALAQAIDRLRS